VAFRVDGTEIDRVDVPALEAGKARTIDGIAWTPAPGEHTVTAHVDPADRIAESDETNDQLDRFVTVTDPAQPALSPRTVTASAAPGDAARATIELANHGGQTAAYRTTASPSAPAWPATVSPASGELAANASTTLTLVVEVPDGAEPETHEVALTTEADGRRAEAVLQVDVQQNTTASIERPTIDAVGLHCRTCFA
jgi:hypothetical protein